jgi:hypothetical protein
MLKNQIQKGFKETNLNIWEQRYILCDYSKTFGLVSQGLIVETCFYQETIGSECQYTEQKSINWITSFLMVKLVF